MHTQSLEHQRLQQEVRTMARSVARGDYDLADELEQDVLLVALNSAPKDPNAMGSWLWAITRNKFRFARYRAAARPRRSSISLMDGLEPAVDDADPEITASRAEVSALLVRLIERLPEIYREAIQLRVVDGLPPRKIAELLGVPNETVRSRVQRGMERLRAEALAVAGEDDARWRWGVGFLGFGRGFNRLKGTTALTAVTLSAVGTSMGVSAWTGHAPTPEDPLHAAFLATGEAVDVEGEPVAQGATRVPSPSTPGAELAAVEVQLVDEDGAPWPSLALQLRSPADAQPEHVEVRAGSALLEDLAPGAWTAWRGDQVIGKMELAGGPQAWRIIVPRRTPVTVEVAGLHDEPYAGAEIYARDGLVGEVRLLGITDPSGTLVTTVEFEAAWLAARGSAGRWSAAKLVDQPRVAAAEGRMRLTMRESRLDWIGLELPEDLDPASVTVRCRTTHPEGFIRSSADEGIIRGSHWLPAWRDEDGKFGLCVRNAALIEVIDSAGNVRAIERRPEKDSEGLVITVVDPINVSGTITDPLGQPLADLPVALLPAGKGTRSLAGTRTNEQGRFVMESVPFRNAALVCLTGSLTESVDLDGSDLFDFGTIVAGARPLAIRWQEPGRRWKVSPLPPAQAKSKTLLEPAPRPTRYEQLVEAKAGLTTIPSIGSGIRGLFLETVDGGEYQTAILTRKRRGWGTAPLLVTPGSAQPVRLSAKLSVSRLPARGRWTECESGIEMAALVDPITGEIASDALPAGTWKLWLMDRSGAILETEPRAVAPGNSESWGAIEPVRGHLRVHVPDAWRTSQTALKLRVAAAEDLAGDAQRLIKRWKEREPKPPFIDVELYAGHQSVLLICGEEQRSGIVDVQPGALVETSLAKDRSLLCLEHSSHFITTRSGAVLELRDESGQCVERWTNLQPLLRGLKSLTLSIPRLSAGTLVLINGRGEEKIRQRVPKKQPAHWKVNVARLLRTARAESSDLGPDPSAIRAPGQ